MHNHHQYSFYCAMRGRRLSQLSNGVQPTSKAVWHSGCHKSPRWDSVRHENDKSVCSCFLNHTYSWCEQHNATSCVTNRIKFVMTSRYSATSKSKVMPSLSSQPGSSGCSNVVTSEIIADLASVSTRIVRSYITKR